MNQFYLFQGNLSGQNRVEKKKIIKKYKKKKTQIISYKQFFKLERLIRSQLG